MTNPYIGHMHTSHPLAGRPFGPAYEEGWIDQIVIGGEIHWTPRIYTDVSLGGEFNKPYSGGLKGPALLINFTTKVRLGDVK